MTISQHPLARSRPAIGIALVAAVAATLLACSTDRAAGPTEAADAAGGARATARYDVTLDGAGLADGAVVLGITGLALDSVSAADAVASLAGDVGGEARVVVAGALSAGVTIRLWGVAAPGTEPRVALREAVDAATLEQRALPARPGIATRRR